MTRFIKQSLAKFIWLVSPYRHVVEAPRFEGSRILLGAPHTSNWDFILMLAIAWEMDLNIKWLGKKELFKGVAGPLMKALGGIPVDRSNPGGLVRQVITMAKESDAFALVITPEGTRSGNGWKSGFYHIARGANLPVTLGFVDHYSHTTGLGPTIDLSGDVVSDMTVIREFYSDKHGVNPQKRTEPRLKEESK